jgi:phosphohistidine phosphatase
MDIVVVRHGVALDREEAASLSIEDPDRPLTAKGRRRMKGAAKGIARLARDADLLLSSPLLRAVQTSKILRRAFEDDIGYTETSSLLPDAEPVELARVLSEGPAIPAAVVVGHEPHLGRWLGWCVSGQDRDFVDLGKGGACLVRFEQDIIAGAGHIVWLLSSALLRRVG